MTIFWNVTKSVANRSSNNGDELNTEQARNLIKEICAADFDAVFFGDSTPLRRDDIYELIGFAASCGLTTLLSTDTAALGQETLQQLKKNGLHRIYLHIQQRVEDGNGNLTPAFKTVIEAMRQCSDCGLEFSIETVFNKDNWDNIQKIITFAASMGALEYQINYPVCNGCQDQETYRGLLTDLALNQARYPLPVKPVCAPEFVPLARQFGSNPVPKRGCLAGISSCSIQPNGDVHPCQYLPVRLGNVKKISFSRLWEENPVFEKLRSQEYAGRCGRCPNKLMCGGCRARAFVRSGDFMGQDPQCIYAHAGVMETAFKV
nr:MoaA-NirJ family Fe-S oxidoreductase [uncultured bacterium]